MLEGGYIGDMGMGVGSKGLGFGVDTIRLFAGVAGVIVFLLLVVLLLCLAMVLFVVVVERVGGVVVGVNGVGVDVEFFLCLFVV